MEKLKITYKDPLKIRNYSISGAIIWTFLLIFLLSYSIHLANRHGIDHAYIYTKVGFDKDVLYRYWVAEHGGVYVKTDSATPPNPYLSHIPDRDIRVDSNVLFTLMNPAYMTRQVYELQEKFNDVRGHITSLKPIRPENAPDEWEIKALQLFETGEKEYYERTMINGVPYFRYMRPFLTEESCLKCHAQHGYVLNDIRGGISTSYPLALVDNETKDTINRNIVVYSLLWLFGILGIVFFYFRLKKSNAKRLRAEESLLKLNESLEHQIEDRTRELLKSRKDWELIFNTLETPAQLIDTNHIIQYVNDITLKVFQLKREDIIGKKCHKLFHFSDKPASECPLVRALEHNQPFRNEMIVEANNTSYIISCTPIYNDDGEIENFMHIMTDISERKEMENALKENKERFETLFNFGGDAIFVHPYNEEGFHNFSEVNNVACDIFGYTKEEFLLRSPLDITKRNDANKRGSKVERKQLRKEGNRIFEAEMIKKSGEVFSVEINSNIIVLNNESLILSIVRDITERKIAEKLLKEHKNKLDLIFETIPLSVNLIDENGIIVDCNSGLLELHGYQSKEELIGKSGNLFFPDFELKRFQKDFKNIIGTDIPIHLQYTLKRKDGSLFKADVSASNYTDESSKESMVVSTAYDISERVSIELKLEEYRLHLEELVKERTNELQEKNQALERVNKLFIGRENRMAELKKEIEKLKNTSTGSV